MPYLLGALLIFVLLTLKAGHRRIVCVTPAHHNPNPSFVWHVQVFPDAILHREEADYQANLRAQKLEESQKAYKAGQKANAHELSVEVWFLLA